MRLEFEWDADNAEANFQSHGVRFELAQTVFRDPFAVDLLDDRQDYGEDRFALIGMAEGSVLLFVAYTEVRTAFASFRLGGLPRPEQDHYFRQNA